MRVYGLLILTLSMFSCIFSGIVARDVIVKNRRVLKRNKLDKLTRKEILDAIDQKEWEEKLHKLYSTFPFWYII